VARIAKILYQGQPGVSDTALYTVPTATKTTITGVLAANTDADTKYFDLYISPSGTTGTAPHCIAKQQKLVGTSAVSGAGIWDLDFPIPLNTAGDMVRGLQETATAVTVTIIGFEEAI
jgi:hypothetical protein